MSADGSAALALSNVGFLINGALTLKPSAAQLNNLRAGDYLVILPPPSKSDQFGIVWGSLLIYVPYSNGRSNAARLVAQILKARPNAPAGTPLFLQGDGNPFSHYLLDRVLKAWLLQIGLTQLQASMYSFHSARAFLACALAAAERSPDVIQALLRWQSVDSLRVYVALNPSAYAQHLTAAFDATVAGIRGAHFPLIDSMDLARQMQAQL